MVSYERLCMAIADSDWNCFVDILKPKYFPRDEKGKLIEKKILAKVSETLTDPTTDIPTNVRIVLLKCLVNSCVDGYTHDECAKNNIDHESSRYYFHKFYSSLSSVDLNDNSASFPYDGIIERAVDYILKFISDSQDSSMDHLEIVRLSVQFLCNLSSFACKSDNLPRQLKNDHFKDAIMILAGSDHVPFARAACAYVHNALKKLPQNYYTGTQVNGISQSLIKADKLGIQSAGESLILLMKRPAWLATIYENLSMESKLYLLEIIHQNVRESVYSEHETEMITNFPSEVVQFISERFRKRSDLILKTVDSYLDGMEPTEITLLLDTIGVISSKDSFECHLLQNDKSLVINCIFLLKSLHMAGRESENYFTPVQKLSEIAPCNQQTENSSDQSDIQNHPAFGFKAGLIRAIGNLAHKHKGNQELLRETDTIPLLLDCCNIDARNPLIIQWTIFALRNLCDNNPENQKIIRNCNRVGIVDNEIIREMGLKLHEGEDGKAIGILPLPRNK